MKNNNILIQSIKWDIPLRDTSSAGYWQELVSAFSNHVLPTIIEQSLLPFNDATRLISLDTIELNLPKITEPTGLREAFEQEWQQFVKNNFPENLVINERPGTIAKRLTELSYFLDFGYLPWQADKSFFSDPSSVKDFLMELLPEELKQWLISAGPYSQQLKRLITLLTLPQFRLVFMRAFGNQELCVEIENFFRYFFSNVTSVFFTENIEKQIWFALASIIITDPDITFDQVALKITEIIFHKTADPSSSLETHSQSLEIKVSGKSMEQVPVPYTRVIQAIVERHHPASVLRKTDHPGIMDEPMPLVQDHDPNFFIDNAGITLLYPYLKILFRRRGLLDKHNHFKNREANLFACWLLQAVATGNSQPAEFELVLPKLLCGYKLNDPVSWVWSPTDAKPRLASHFLANIINHWSSIKNISVNGLRGNFLLRPGKLIEEQQNWILHVEKRGWDILLDTLPYPLSVINLPWMTKPLYVQW